MRNALIFSLVAICLLVGSCQSESRDDLQYIDQILKVYVRNEDGKDLLNKNIDSSFYNISMVDLEASRNDVSVSYSQKQDVDTVNFIEYTSGATRVLESGDNATQAIYRSTIGVRYQKNTETTFDQDTMIIYYRFTPTVFEISTVNYNRKEVFTKEDGIENIVGIVK